MGSGLVLQAVRLIHYQVLIVGDEIAAHYHVGEQKGVVYHNDVGLIRFFVGAAHKAGAAVAHSGAPSLLPGGYPVPRKSIPAGQVNLAPVSGYRVLQPHCRFAKQARILHTEVVASRQLVPPAQAQIIALPFERRRLHHAFFHQARPFQHSYQGRYVLAEQLFLEIDGLGGDHHSAAAGNGEEDRGEKVGHRFSDAGGAFHHQVARLIDGLGDAGEHLFLFGTVFKAGKGLGKRSRGAQKVYDIVLVNRAQVTVHPALFRP